MPPRDRAQAAPRAVRVVPREAVVAAALDVERQQVRAEVLPEYAAESFLADLHRRRSHKVNMWFFT